MKHWLAALAFLIAPMVPTATAHAQTTRPATQPVRVSGTLRRVEGQSLIIQLRQPEDGQTDAIVATGEKTRIALDREAAKLSDLKPGMTIAAWEGPVSFRSAAKVLNIMASSPSTDGILTAIDGKTLTVSVADAQGETKTVKFKADDKIRVMVPAEIVNRKLAARARTGSIDDLKPDMLVQVISTDGIATKVLIQRPDFPAAGPKGALRPTTRNSGL